MVWVTWPMAREDCGESWRGERSFSPLPAYPVGHTGHCNSSPWLLLLAICAAATTASQTLFRGVLFSLTANLLCKKGPTSSQYDLDQVRKGAMSLFFHL